MLQCQRECCDGRGAEAFAGEGDLAVGIVVKELDKAVEAVEIASAAVDAAVSQEISLTGTLQLLAYIFHDTPDNPDDGQYK